MERIRVFENPKFGAIRTVTVDGEPWFIGRDVAQVLGYKNADDTLYIRVDPRDKAAYPLTTPKGEQETVIINEFGLHTLIYGSTLAAINDFKDWLAGEVFPALRKPGRSGALESCMDKLQREQENDRLWVIAQVMEAKCRIANLFMSLWDRCGVEPKYQAMALNELCSAEGVRLPPFSFQHAQMASRQEPVTPKDAARPAPPTPADEKKMYDKEGIAKKLGLYTKKSEPHTQAVEAILAKLKIAEDGGKGLYTEQAVEKIGGWLQKYNFPAPIEIDKKKYKVVYTGVEKLAS